MGVSIEQKAVSSLVNAARVKEALAAARIATVRQIAARLDVPDADYRGRERVRWILRDLVAHGLARVERAHGELFYAWTEKAGCRGAKQALLWRAMTTAPHGFTISEIAMLAGTDRDYAKRYIGWLRREDWLEDRGQRTLASGIKARVYRIVPGKEDAPAPGWNRRKEERKKDTGTRGHGDGETAKLIASGQVRLGEPGPVERAWGAGREVVKNILDGMEETLAQAAGSVKQGQDLLAEVRQDLAKVDLEFIHQGFDRKLAKRADLGITTPAPTLPPQ